MEAGEPELAIEAYLRAAIQRGLDAEVLAGLGSANLQLGRLGQAERLLSRAVEEDPAFVPAWNNLGVVLTEQERATEAVAVFERAAALDSGETAAIADNLELARSRQVSQPAPAGYREGQKPKFALVRRGAGHVLIRRLPD